MKQARYDIANCKLCSFEQYLLQFQITEQADQEKDMYFIFNIIRLKVCETNIHANRITNVVKKQNTQNRVKNAKHTKDCYKHERK